MKINEKIKIIGQTNKIIDFILTNNVQIFIEIDLYYVREVVGVLYECNSGVESLFSKKIRKMIL